MPNECKHNNSRRFDDWDNWFCPECKQWLSPKCPDPECSFCACRPDNPFDQE